MLTEFHSFLFDRGRALFELYQQGPEGHSRRHHQSAPGCHAVTTDVARPLHNATLRQIRWKANTLPDRTSMSRKLFLVPIDPGLPGNYPHQCSERSGTRDHQKAWLLDYVAGAELAPGLQLLHFVLHPPGLGLLLR